MESVTVLHVKYNCDHSLIPVGRLTLRERKIAFEYETSFLQTGLELSPLKLPLQPGMIFCQDNLFDGLFGVFNDGIPDGWGRLLLDRKLMKLGMNPLALSPLDRLSYVGKHGMGALVYEPEISGVQLKKYQYDLDVIASECMQFQEYDDDQYIDDLLIMNGSSAGARPKVLINLISNDQQFKISDNSSKAKHNDWIVKFRSSHDPKDIGPIEYAYHLMAIEAGLNVPEARLFKSKKSAGYFGVKRFDRDVGAFKHMHTMSGLVHADYRIPSLDYQAIIKATAWLTKDSAEVEKQFRQAVFNVLTHNRDDHGKNFSFLMQSDGKWQVSPAYDLNYSSGPAGEHSTTVMGEGKTPALIHILQLADIAAIPLNTAKQTVEQVRLAVSKWNEFASIANVGRESCQQIERVLRKLDAGFKSIK